MDVIIICKKVHIAPEYLDANIKKHILEKLKKDLEDSCTEEHGYIMSIDKIVTCQDNTVSMTSSVIFIVKFEATRLKPKIGDIMEGIVTMISSHGIFVKSKNLLRIFIPNKILQETGIEFDFSSNSYSTSEKTIKMNDNLEVRITNVRYSSAQAFSCMGEINCNSIEKKNLVRKFKERKVDKK